MQHRTAESARADDRDRGGRQARLAARTHLAAARSGARSGRSPRARLPIRQAAALPPPATSRTRASGSRSRTMSVTTAATSAPAANTPAQALERQPADGDQRSRADAPLPFAEALETLRLPRHHFEQRRVDGPERHVVRSGASARSSSLVVVRADAEPHARRGAAPRDPRRRDPPARGARNRSAPRARAASSR